MKKFLTIAMALVLTCLTFTSCGNMSMGIGNYDFTHIHISDHIEGYCLEVEKWYDSEGEGIEVKTTDGGSFFLSEGTYTLISSKYNCPFCEGG